MLENEAELYPEHLFTDKMKTMVPKMWWSLLKRKAIKSEDQDQIKFTTFMVNLHSCPSSSASLERWFSTFGFIWSKQRNRLGHEKALKLTRIFESLRTST